MMMDDHPTIPCRLDGIHNNPNIPFGNLLQFFIENGPLEIVDLPINSMVIFHSYEQFTRG
jgi:hypothetical protein